MEIREALLNYVIRLGDNAHILGHRLSEWCGHGPVLEQDIAISNIALDLIGQARSLYQYAGQLEGNSKTEDQVAYLRDAHQFRNFLLVEQPNTDWAYTIVRQFFYDAYCFPFYELLKESRDTTLSAIAEKSLKEVAYHLKYSSEWMIRLGDGTAVSHQKMQAAVDDLWTYTGEMLTPNQVDIIMANSGTGVDLSKVQERWFQRVNQVMTEATLSIPADQFMQQGGKDGKHTENLGYILAEMQYLQRTYPGLEW